MDLFDYLNDYQYKTIDKYPLNEIDMVLFSILAYPHYEEFIGKKEISITLRRCLSFYLTLMSAT